MTSYTVTVGGKQTILLTDQKYYIWYAIGGVKPRTMKFFGATFDRYDIRRRLLYFTTPKGNPIEVPEDRLLNVV